MKKYWAMLSLVTFFIAGTLAAQQKVVEEIVARVNDDIVTRSDYDKNRQQLRQDLGQQYFGAELERQLALKEKNVLRDLIDQLLLIQRAKEVGVNVDTDLVKYLDRLREENHLKTLDDLERMATQQGVNYEDFKNNIKNNLYTQIVIRQEVGRRVQITQEAISKFYEEHKQDFERPAEVRFREILISTEGKDPEQVKEAEKKAADLAARARKGEDFAELARKNSDGPTAKEGGVQDYIQRSQLIKEIADVLFKMKRNEISDPILTKFGYKVLKLEEKHEAGLQPVEKVSDQISNALYMQRLTPVLREYLTQAREQAFVEIKPGFEDTGAAPLVEAKAK